MFFSARWLGAATSFAFAVFSFAASATAPPVGTLAGTFAVSPSGASTYHVPLNLPPGLGGMTPTVSLDYNSQGPDQFMGPGWGVSGPSQIARCGSTYATDGITLGIQPTNTVHPDHFCLDGQRLISAGTATYHTEVESFNLVTSYGSATNPSYFQVKTKSGLTMIYGQTGKVTNTIAGTSYTYIWLLDSTTDTVGNTIHYNYTISSGEYVPQSITYGDNTNAGLSSAYISVNFTYGTRTGYKPTGYLAGLPLTHTKLLTRIDATVSGTTTRHWELSYTQSTDGDIVVPLSSGPASQPPPPPGGQYQTQRAPRTSITTDTSTAATQPIGRDILTGIAECAGSDSTQCINPTQFTWYGGLGTYSDAAGSPALGTANWSHFVGDFNGDGKADLMGAKTSGGSITAFVALGGSLGGTPVFGLGSVNETYGSANFASGDFNGDGKTDLVTSKVGTDPSCEYVGTLMVNTSTGTGFATGVTSSIGADPFTAGPPACRGDQTQATGVGLALGRPYVGDFNGDGLDDVLMIETYGSSTYLQLMGSSGTPNAVLSRGNYYGGFPTSGWTPQVVDVNGDGLPDLVFVHVDGSGIHVNTYVNPGNGMFSSTPNWAGQVSTSSSANLLFADIDGDGAVDIVVTQQSGTSGSIFTYAAVGDGTYTYAGTQSVTLSNSDQRKTIAGDFNGDGLSDVAWVDASTTPQIDLSLSTGSNGTYAIGTSGALPNSFPLNHVDYAGDFDGDGKVDVLNFNDNSATLDTLPGAPFLRLQTIQNGFGASVTMDYAPLTSSSVYADDGANATFPNRPARGGQYVVYQTGIDNPGNSQRIAQYRYTDARVHSQGRGYLGFMRVDSTDMTGSGVEPIDQFTIYRQDFPYVGMASTTETLDTATNLKFSETDNTPTYLVPSGQHYYVVSVHETKSQGFEISSGYASPVTSTDSVFDYDQYGNLKDSDVKVYTGDFGAGAVFETSTTNLYNSDDPTNWILGRLTSTSVTRSDSVSGQSLTRSSGFSYDSSTHLLASETVEPNSSTLLLNTAYQRDGFGNITLTTVSGPDIVTRSSSNAFSTSSPYFGRFNTQSCNALSQCMTRSFDAGTGNVTSETDANAQTTNFAYDGFGRITSKTYIQSGISQTTTYIRQTTDANGDSGLGASIPLAVMETDTVAPDGSTTGALYDASEREIAKGWVTPDGANTIGVITKYDAAGRKYATSSPTIVVWNDPGWSPHFWTTVTQFDAMSRPMTVTSPVDVSNTLGTTTYYYNGLTITVTDANNHRTIKTLNAIGKVVSVTDASNNTASYGYDPYENLTSTTAPGSVGTTMVYDIRGHKTQMTDPDTGVWNYHSDTLGQLKSQTDAKNQTTTMDYDVLGRMTVRNAPEDNTRWTYDTSWKGALTSVTQYQGTGSTVISSHSYTYWPFGAVKTDTTVIGGSSYTYNFAYDTVGRVVQTTYPNGFSTAQNYYGYGGLNSIYQPGNSSSIYWRGNSYDVWNHPENETYGNGLTPFTYRDDATGRISSQMVGNGTLQSWNYAWDPVGNLTSRTDQTQGGLTETFQYDALNRVTATLLSGPGINGQVSNGSQAYSALGNITTKSDIGSYTYGGPRPHAVTQAGSTAYGYDADGNMTTAGSRVYTWASYNLPTRLDAGTGFSTFVYGPNRERLQQAIYSSSQMTTVNYAGGGFEDSVSGGVHTYRNYIASPSGVIALVTQSSGMSDQIEYFTHDHLGSIDTVTSSSGALLQKLAYDAFGKRQASNWQGPAGVSFLTDRGYTGHMMIDGLSLIHMGGRVYDPTIGRFLSPDPTIQEPGNLQNWNRYSYVLNNPLEMTDPSGFHFLHHLWHDIKSNWRTIAAVAIAVVAPELIPGIWGVALGGFAAGMISSNGNLQAGLIGAATAVAFLGASGVFSTEEDCVEVGSSEYNGLRVTDVVVHGAIGGLSAVASGGKFGAGALSALVPAAANAVGFGGGPIGNALVGGTAAVVGGGKFGNGALTATYYYVAGYYAGAVRVGESPLTASLDLVGKIWALPSSVIGLALAIPGYAISWIDYGFGGQDDAPNIRFLHNAIEFTNNVAMFLGGAMTFGNIELFARSEDAAYGEEQVGWMHEWAHTIQAQLLGPFYLPLAGGSLAAGALLNGDPHGSASFMEVGPSSDPPRPWPWH